jgi:hypothetical protein
MPLDRAAMIRDVYNRKLAVQNKQQQITQRRESDIGSLTRAYGLEATGSITPETNLDEFAFRQKQKADQTYTQLEVKDKIRGELTTKENKRIKAHNARIKRINEIEAKYGQFDYDDKTDLDLVEYRMSQADATKKATATAKAKEKTPAEKRSAKDVQIRKLQTELDATIKEQEVTEEGKVITTGIIPKYIEAQQKSIIKEIDDLNYEIEEIDKQEYRDAGYPDEVIKIMKLR